MPGKPPRLIFAAIAPGIPAAATGVGAGDLLTAGIGGSAAGPTILRPAPAKAIGRPGPWSGFTQGGAVQAVNFILR